MPTRISSPEQLLKMFDKEVREVDEFIITEKDAISWKAALIDEFATAQSMSLEDVVRIFNEYRILDTWSATYPGVSACLNPSTLE